MTTTRSGRSVHRCTGTTRPLIAAVRMAWLAAGEELSRWSVRMTTGSRRGRPVASGMASLARDQGNGQVVSRWRVRRPRALIVGLLWA